MTVQRFDLLGPLPAGTTLLEASAGTGKTYTIAALATRYIAEGRATIDQLLMITFGRSATRELQERVREALTRARDDIRANRLDDPVVQCVARAPGALARLSAAVADFDAGTIATTHQFCMQSLAGLGLTADTDPGETFVEDISDLVEEVVDDFYVRKYAGADGPRISPADARKLAREAVNDPQADLAAGPVAEGSIEQTRLRFAQAVRAEVLARRRRRRLVTFDDLVLRLRAALTDPLTGPLACRRLRERHRIVLVDEFQDTDPAQWTILREAFHGHRTLILIGDPKQAIYAFRGADVFSYLEAAEHADLHATLPTNHRSDDPVVRGVGVLMGGLQLGDPRIVVHPVAAAHTRPRLELPHPARVRLRTWHPADGDPCGVGESRRVIAADVAADIVATLTGPGRLLPDGRPVAPGDIAVLVSTHVQGAMVRDALDDAGVPVVIGSATSVFATAAAQQWLTLLQAMDNPRTTSLRAAALTDFCGRTAGELMAEGDRVDQEVGLQLRTWARVLEGASVAALLAFTSRETDLAARMLTRPGGERELTDLRHVAGILHAQQRRDRLGLVGVMDWLAERVRRAAENDREASQEMTRRLETDAAAVQVLTVHGSKGLEFPIAYVPFGWDRSSTAPDTLRCHDRTGRRVLDLRGTGAVGRDDLLAAHQAEEAGESLRLLYVAMTRASRQLVLHWASSKRNTGSAPLHRVLSARAAGHRVTERSYPVAGPPVGGVRDSPWIRVEPVPDAAVTPRWEPAVESAPHLSSAPFTRRIDVVWRRTSYTGLTAGAHGPEAAPAGFRDDEPEEAEVVPAAPGPAVPSPFADLPAGAAFGTLVHSVLESLADDADDAGLPDRCREALAANPVPGVEAAALAVALQPGLHTPLGHGLPALVRIAPGDRLAELDFELPMHGGSLTGIADLLRAQLPADDPLTGYPDRLASLPAARLRGYLTGSIDAVLRVADRYLVVDYKTNLLREPGGEQFAWNYRPSALAEAMIGAHYPLQALLYSAALHRYLRWRVPGYDPAAHLGGVRYLFLRGMAGPATPLESGVPCGVFAWHPPAALIVALSELLDGRPC